MSRYVHIKNREMCEWKHKGLGLWLPQVGEGVGGPLCFSLSTSYNVWLVKLNMFCCHNFWEVRSHEKKWYSGSLCNGHICSSSSMIAIHLFEFGKDSMSVPCWRWRAGDFPFTCPSSVRCDNALKLNLKAVSKCKWVVPFWTHFELRIILLQRQMYIKYDRVQADSGYQTCHCVCVISLSKIFFPVFFSPFKQQKQ